jgi:hypothetical protein
MYSELPARFPRLYRRLALSYRWAEVDLQSCRLPANPPGAGLRGSPHEMSRDSNAWRRLLEAGHIRFGKGPGADYDPFRFDTSSRPEKEDYKIVKLDRERILCHERIGIVAGLSPGFEQLMPRTIDEASLGRLHLSVNSWRSCSG